MRHFLQIAQRMLQTAHIEKSRATLTQQNYVQGGPKTGLFFVSL